MSTEAPRPTDFDALYRGDFDALTGDAPSGPPGFRFDRVPWDIGEAQPVVRALESEGEIESDVLDIGCGPGENTIFLAGHGYRVWGLDAAPAAIDIARGRARDRRVGDAVTFEVADATDLGGWADRFTTIVDSALYHCFPEGKRAAYVAELHRAARSQCRLHLLCFSDRVPDGFPGPFRIDEDNLRGTLADGGWHIRRLERTTYTTAMTRADFEGHDEVAALAAELGLDANGRLLAPAWLATAERR
ncbi:SAM-dependent methyltransferase [Prescottella subtropica]|uniref:SAM-dependent methyltransferase n=1 Tax=Prescottella subtropica TaxID=2545757 RepID=UPI0010F671C6|nr:class I SAM-dependent methyltransferase [Prescottella subtropica]